MKDYTWRYVSAALLIFVLIGWGLQPVSAAETAPVVAATASTVTLESSLVSIIQSVQTGVQAGVTFLSAEIPDVLRQLLMWKMVNALIYGVLFFILTTVSLCILRKTHKAEPMEADHPLLAIGWLVSLASAAVFLFLSVDKFLVSLQILIAPKVWLIEYAASLVK